MLMLRDFPVQLNSVRSVLLTVALCVAPGALAAPFSMSDGVAVTGADGNQVKMFGFATFWILTDYDKNGGSNNPWCAVYVGPSAAPGTPNGPGTTTSAGASFLRLIQ